MRSSHSEQLIKTMVSDPAMDGKPAKLYVLTNKQGMSVTLMDIGATWLSCEIPVAGARREVLLGVKTMKAHQQQNAFLGATVGRFANRIAQGKFTLAGQAYQLSVNQDGNTLHGGKEGFDKRRWQAEQERDNGITFTLQSEDGDQGFPGNLQVSVRYQLSADNELLISYQAQCDQDCPVNLTNHAYFNLMGSESEQDCLSHKLLINAQDYLPIDSFGIPLGELQPVTQTSFDFRQLKEIGEDFLTDPQQQSAGGYDHAFIIDKGCRDGKKVAVKCISPDGKVMLEVRTTKPAIQLYTGNYVQGTPNRCGGEYKQYAGLALETQFLPDSPNHREWDQPSSILLSGQGYQQQTVYKLSINEQ